jgi:hypothetical protein
MKRKPKFWIQAAHPKKGALHRQLGIPEGSHITNSLLLKYRHAPGKLGKRVRFALNLRKAAHK